MKIKEYDLVNDEKLIRAAEGTQTSQGSLVGGVGYENEELLLATYDKLGGLVEFGGRKVKTGAFWDFKLNKPVVKPEPVLEISIGEEIVEVPVGEKLPIEVEAYEILKKKKSTKKVAKKKKDEDEE